MNTLPLELQALTTTVTTPEIYALGTRDDGRLLHRHRRRPGDILTLRARQAAQGSDAGKGMV